jgi:hypothetical protein
LSTTAKEKGVVGTQTGQTRLEDSSMNVEPAEVARVEEDERKPKATQFRIANPSRIAKSQADVCVFDTQQRYRTIRADRPGNNTWTDSVPAAAAAAAAAEEEEVDAITSPMDEPEGDFHQPNLLSGRRNPKGKPSGCPSYGVSLFHLSRPFFTAKKTRSKDPSCYPETD